MIWRFVVVIMTAQVLGSGWMPPVRALAPATQPTDQLVIQYRYAPDGEDDLVGFIVRLQRTDSPNETLVVRLTLGDPKRNRLAMTPNTDYVAPPELVIIPARQMWLDVRIPLVDDDDVESVETLFFGAQVIDRLHAPASRPVDRAAADPPAQGAK
jgi:hypothetical protein